MKSHVSPLVVSFVLASSIVGGGTCICPTSLLSAPAEAILEIALFYSSKSFMIAREKP